MTENYPKLKILSEKDRGKVFELKKRTCTCGRSHDNDIVLDDSSVSTKHCSFTEQAGWHEVKDLGSTNGTLVNNVEISNKQLKHKDIILIGEIEFLYDSGDLKERTKEQVESIKEEPAKKNDIKGKATINFGNSAGNMPLGNMENFSPFAGTQSGRGRIVGKLAKFLCIGISIAVFFLLIWIFFVS
jgi:pSer/pThr/pTyr-binding forkhead associated (FHA) protein